MHQQQQQQHGHYPQHHHHQQHHHRPHHNNGYHQHMSNGNGHSNGHGMNMPLGASDSKAFRRDMKNNSTEKKMERETEFFWTVCSKNKEHQQRAPRQPLDKEERELFGKQGSVGIKFNAYEAIPVECNGPGSEDFTPMGSFNEIRDGLPNFVLNNILKMKYDVPTPIQKYAVPLGLSSSDLMCCAQTVCNL